MGKPSAPAAPDYTAAAEETANSSRINQNTPYGSLTYSAPASGVASDPWTQNINLSPVGQQLLDAANNTSLGLSNLQGQGLAAVQNSMNNLPSEAALPAAPINAGQTAQDAIMERIQPALNQQQDRMNNQLADQGIAQGSDAYALAQKQFGQQANDAYTQAGLQGITAGEQAQQQALQLQNYYANEPLNMLNALTTGSQVTNPTFGSTAGAINYSGAAGQTGTANLNAYNAQTGASNSLTNGLFSLGGSALENPSSVGSLINGVGSFFNGLSDRRLKSNIIKIGIHPLGIGIYEYDIFGVRTRGVMADEVKTVMPEAVTRRPDGYDMVNYGMING